jgi:hypothetical protein
MPLKDVLSFLFQQLGRGKKRVTVNYYEKESWEPSVLSILEDEQLLIRAENAKQIICTACEKLCDKSIQTHYIPLSAVSFSVKKVSDEDNRKIPNSGFHCLEHNNQWIGVITDQWQLTNQMLINWLTNYLRLNSPKEANRAGIIQIGTATLSGENYTLALGNSEKLILLVNGDAVPIADIFHVSEGGAIEVDTSLIENARGNRKRVTPKRLNKEKRDAQLFEKYGEIKAKSPLLKTDDKVIRQLMKDKELVGDLAPESVRRILSNQKKVEQIKLLKSTY